MKIGILCYPTYGGSGALATELGLHLARRGHSVCFLAYGLPFRLQGEERANIRFRQIGVMEYPLFPGALYTLTAAVEVREAILAEGLEVLHVHYALPHAISGFLANEMLPPESRVPVLSTLHGTDITLMGRSPEFRPAVKLGLDKSDGLTCVSQWLSDQTCRHFDICERLTVVHNFVDPEVFHPGERPSARRSDFAAPDEAVLLHVSNFRAVKRPGDVVRTFAGVRARRPARLILAGEGPELERALALAREFGVSDSIHSLGARQDVAALYGSADLLLFPSDGESFGLAAAEAMASEVPVVGAAAGGLPEVAIDGEHGRLLPVGDHEGMARAALDLLENPDRRAALGRAGRRRILEKFSPDIIVPRYEAQYRMLLRKRSGAA